jgi:hypothetical protein
MSAPIDFPSVFLNICLLDSADCRNLAAGRNSLLSRRRTFALLDDDGHIRTLIQR